MKSTRLLLIVATLTMAGCATSLGPSDNFNDWTNSASYRHTQEPRGAVAAVARHADDSDNKTAGQ
jgi:uncharacterized lipoprotein YmbA